jgi:hypothetical protein
MEEAASGQATTTYPLVLRSNEAFGEVAALSGERARAARAVTFETGVSRYKW